MATITEDYVSFEIAKLLKDKGFNEKCLCWYVANEPQEGIAEKGFGENQFYINAPTLQLACKWLRIVHNFHIWVEPNHDKEGLYNAHVKVGQWSNNWAGVGYNSYEKAAEAAIKYCLENLI